MGDPESISENMTAINENSSESIKEVTEKQEKEEEEQKEEAPAFNILNFLESIRNRVNQANIEQPVQASPTQSSPASNISDMLPLVTTFIKSLSEISANQSAPVQKPHLIIEHRITFG